MQFVYATAILFAGLRIILKPSDSLAFNCFKDFAHIFVGALIGGAVYGWPDPLAKELAVIAICISLVELLCALPKIWKSLKKSG